MALQLPPIFATLQPALILAANVFTLAIGPNHRVLQFAFSIPVLSILAAQSLYRDWDRGWGLHYGLNCFVVTSLVTWIDWILLNSPYKERWVKLEQHKGAARVKDGGVAPAESPAFPEDDSGVVRSKNSMGNPVEKRYVPASFLQRFWWSGRLATTNRYVGWSSEVKNVPASVPSTYPRWSVLSSVYSVCALITNRRRKFLARKTLRFALFFALKDAIYSYTASSPHGTWLDLHPETPVISLAGYPFMYRLYWTWVYIALTYISLELMTTLYSLVSVASLLATPSECPRMFNDLKGCYTVRRSWSIVWHQQMRRLCAVPGTALARDVLNLPRGSFASKYTQLFVGFAVSGLIHAVAAMLCHRSLQNDDAMRVFMYQAVLIFVEDHVIDFGKRWGFRDSRFWRVVGFVWTMLAVGTSLQGWTSKTLGHGLWVHDREKDFFGLGPR